MLINIDATAFLAIELKKVKFNPLCTYTYKSERGGWSTRVKAHRFSIAISMELSAHGDNRLIMSMLTCDNTK